MCFSLLISFPPHSRPNCSLRTLHPTFPFFKNNLFCFDRYVCASRHIHLFKTFFFFFLCVLSTLQNLPSQHSPLRFYQKIITKKTNKTNKNNKKKKKKKKKHTHSLFVQFTSSPCSPFHFLFFFFLFFFAVFVSFVTTTDTKKKKNLATAETWQICTYFPHPFPPPYLQKKKSEFLQQKKGRNNVSSSLPATLLLLPPPLPPPSSPIWGHLTVAEKEDKS